MTSDPMWFKALGLAGVRIVVELLHQRKRLFEPSNIGADPGSVAVAVGLWSFHSPLQIRLRQGLFRHSPGIGTLDPGIQDRKRMPTSVSETRARQSFSKPVTAREALRSHWPEYLMEAAALGSFMVSACVFGVLLEHPSSPLNQWTTETPIVRRALGGMAMGLTAITIFFSPWGKRSGAHMNPAVTLTFLSLGKVARWDALFYVAFQFAGGIAGVAVAYGFIGPPLQHAAVNYVVTAPGPGGPGPAFLAEFLISALMMSMVLWVSNSRRFSRWTPILAGFLIATFITFEAPYSGMSMNPARTAGSGVSAGQWTALWVYFAAPILAMLSASIAYRLLRGTRRVFCAKFHHHNNQPCIFRCRYGELHAK
jgi:aquaporin Z